jgi:hypothetical protein
MQSNYDLFLRHLIDNSSRLHGIIKIKITRAGKQKMSQLSKFNCKSILSRETEIVIFTHTKFLLLFRFTVSKPWTVIRETDGFAYPLLQMMMTMKLFYSPNSGDPQIPKRFTLGPF